MGNGKPPRNPIGRNVSRLRSEKDWSQEDLATFLQCEGVDASRDMLARVDLCLTRVNIEFLLGLHRVFRLPLIRFFPKHVQDLDAKFTKGIVAHLSGSASSKKPRRKCQKLTKRKKGG